MGIAFRHILCPTDFSETAVLALGYATALARRYGARLTLLHVVPVFEEHLESAVLVGDQRYRPHAPARAAVLEQMRLASVEAGAAPLDPAFLAEEGRAHAVILDRVASLQPDLLVLGTHGRGGFNRLLLGSVTEKLVRTASCPVLTVPPSAPSPTSAPTVFRNILCPIDLSPSSLKALQLAIDVAREADGHVTVLYALEYMDNEEPCDHVAASLRNDRQAIIDAARQRLHAAVQTAAVEGCDLDETVVIDRAYKATLRHAMDTPTDLIVMGAQGRGAVEVMLYGSNTQHVVRAATCPVLTVRA